MHTGNADFVQVLMSLSSVVPKGILAWCAREKDSPNYVVPIKAYTKLCSAINDTKRLTKLCRVGAGKPKW